MKNIIKIKILGHNWSVRFLKRNLMHEENNGTCWVLHSAIDIADDLTKEEAKFVITHELGHAILGICGRTFEKGLDHEAFCETVAFHIDEIVRVRDLIMKERFKNE